jgi:hypothetical protein
VIICSGKDGPEVLLTIACARLPMRSSMDDHTALSQLEGLAYMLGIPVRYEKIAEEDVANAGGLCRLKGECVIIVNSRAAVKDKVQTLVKALKNFDLNDVYMRPAVRELLER